MKIIIEQSLRDFDFSDGAAKDLVDRLSLDELNAIDDKLDEIYPKGLGDIELDYLFWTTPGYVCSLIELDYDEVIKREREY